MKRILVTGAAGMIGYEVIKYLLSEGKYEVTALDLKNNKVHTKFKKYKNRINVIYGDVCNRVLIEDLVKEHDVIIHLATILPPIADLKKELSEVIIHDTTENIVRAINYYNPTCHLIYGSSTSLYGTDTIVSNKTKLKCEMHDSYSKNVLKSEKLIHDKLKKYSIIRIPLVLSSDLKDNMIYNIKNNMTIATITKEDAAYAIVKSLDEVKSLNRKTINIGGSVEFNVEYKNLIKTIVNLKGLSFNLILSDIFLDKNYYSPIARDVPKIEELLKYQSDTWENFTSRLRYNGRRKRFSKLLGKLYLKIRRYK